MDCLTLPRLREYDSTCEEHRNKNKKQFVQSHGVIYTDCRQVSDWTVTLTATMTLTLIPNPNPTEGKREILRLNFFESYFEVDDIFWGR